jgi:hypothetical protein
MMFIDGEQKVGLKIPIDKINSKAGYNLIDSKYQEMPFQSVPTSFLFGI